MHSRSDQNFDPVYGSLLASEPDYTRKNNNSNKYTLEKKKEMEFSTHTWRRNEDALWQGDYSIVLTRT